MRSTERVVLALSLFTAIANVQADHPTLGVGSGAGAAITTTSATPLGAGRKVLSVDLQAIEFDPISDAILLEESFAHRHAHSTDRLYQVAVSGSFGLTDNLSVGFSQPYIRREELREGSHHGHVGAEQLGDADGIGDLRLYAHYRFLKTGNTDVALIGGIKAPSGSTDEKSNSDQEFDIELQPGSGSWDAFSGLAWSQQWSGSRWSLHGNLLYTAVTEGDRDTDLGDIGNYNLAAAYQHMLGSSHDHGRGHSHHHDHHGIIDFIIELNGEWRDRIDIDGDTEKNSGGNIVYLSPGMRLGLWQKTSLTLSVGVPVVENQNGEQSEPEMRAVASVNRSF